MLDLLHILSTTWSSHNATGWSWRATAETCSRHFMILDHMIYFVKFISQTIFIPRMENTLKDLTKVIRPESAIETMQDFWSHTITQRICACAGVGFTLLTVVAMGTKQQRSLESCFNAPSCCRNVHYTVYLKKYVDTPSNLYGSVHNIWEK
jgi:hypothetical protein